MRLITACHWLLWLRQVRISMRSELHEKQTWIFEFEIFFRRRGFQTPTE